MTRRFLSYIATTCFLVAAMCAGASADTVFYDDFSDGNAQDWMPVSWIGMLSFPGAIDASSGDLSISPSGGAVVTVARSSPDEMILDDVSIRAQVRMVGTPDSGAALSLLARGDTGNATGYFGGITNDGTVYIDRSGTGPDILDEEETDLRPADEDVLLQFDVFGTMLRVWAWRPGEPIPNDPLVEVTQDVYSEGEVGAAYGTGLAVPEPGAGILRFIRVATTHIPEPSTFALAALAFLAVLCRVRRR